MLLIAVGSLFKSCVGKLILSIKFTCALLIDSVVEVFDFDDLIKDTVHLEDETRSTSQFPTKNPSCLYSDPEVSTSHKILCWPILLMVSLLSGIVSLSDKFST